MAKTSGITPDKILDIAETLISVKGMTNTSLSDIAKAANISKGTLYYHFPNKELIMYSLAERYFLKISEEPVKWIENLGKKVSPEEMIRLIFNSAIDETDTEKLHLNFLLEVISGNEELRDKFKERYKEWESILADTLVKVYNFNQETAKIGGALIMTLIEGFSVRKIITGGSTDFEKLSPAIATILKTLGSSKYTLNLQEDENEQN